MRKFAAVLLIAALLLLSLALLVAGPTRAQEPEPAPDKDTPLASTPAPLDRALLPKIEPQLLKKLIQADGQAVPFIVYLKATANLSAAITTAAPAPGPLARRLAVVRALQQTAQASQGGVLQLLQSPPTGVSGQSVAAADIRPLWIVNAVAARGSLETVLALAARPDVEVVRLDKPIKLERMEDEPGEKEAAGNRPASQSTPVPEWNVSQIRADLVHQALGINGAGFVVANIDSGVDWQHPALQNRYRGYTGPGKLPQHSGNWFDAVGEGALYPVDGNGHGTHTMGTMVGGNGLGVAPGARWMAARAFDSAGNGQVSWLHAAFQWILAPNGNPALAPDIVNNSWGNDDGTVLEFQGDVLALLAAGIFPVFSAGNNGPNPGTVGSPGSLNGVLSVGATDNNDEVTLFSSRGPSSWGRIKPEVVAPGKNVLSSLPGGAYGNKNGTSMAAPHVSGLAALLLQASPALSGNLSQLARVITSSTVPLGSPVPNNDYGWGRVDAYQAVVSVAPIGTLQGAITRLGSSQPISQATVQLTRHADASVIYTASDSSGSYRQGLAAGIYDATVLAFGYEPAAVYALDILTGTVLVQNFSLIPLPLGTLQGTVTDKNALPLAAAITVEGTPAGTATNPATGQYSLSLPTGTYTVTVTAGEHRVAKKVVTVQAGTLSILDFVLDDAPAILLVDSGRWYQESYIAYYQQALDDLLYPYDTWQITQPFATPNDVPTAQALAPYDLVIWSAPLDSPGYVQADEALETYLEQGGRLLLSGQDVAYFDGGGSFFPAPYLKNYLKALFVQDDSGTRTISGTLGGPLANLALTIEGGDGADNQLLPDVIANADSESAGAMLSYTGGGLAGLSVATCLPYRAVYLSFGFEAINSRAGRAGTMAQIVDWLTQATPQVDLELTPPDQTVIGNFGATISHTFRLRNTGSAADVYTLTLAPGVWPADPPALAPLALASCRSQTLDLEVTVGAVDWHTSDVLTITAQSSLDPGQTWLITRTTKSPAPVLLVDDHRWRDYTAEYEEALQANGISYDIWPVARNPVTPNIPLSPPLETLQMYPFALWYTAADWYQPLTTAEEERLGLYLAGGGRLFLSSQDYLYRLPGPAPSPFATDYLGVFDHVEDFASTLMVGERGSPVGAHLGPEPLTFPSGYNNWTDALTPTATARVATRGQEGQINGLTHAGLGSGGEAWRTLFLAYGPELLASEARARFMGRAVGWLSWLGGSTVTPSRPAALNGDLITYTAVITNDGWAAVTAAFTATFPAELLLETASPELTPAGADLAWSGMLTPGESKTFVYTARLDPFLPVGTVVSQTNWLAYPEHQVLFDRVADVYVNFPDLTGSVMEVTPASGVARNDILTYTLLLKNTGLTGAAAVTTTNQLPPMLDLIAVDAASQGDFTADTRTITWTTALAPNEVATLTYRAAISYEVGSAINNVAYVEDGIGQPVPLQARATFKVLSVYLPAIIKGK